jgi:steroid 5-alpha reductase family enzyme
MNIFRNAALFTFGLQLAGFVVAAILQTEVFYDILGGINFLTLAYLGYSSSSSISSSTSSFSSQYSTTPLLQYATILFVISRGWLLAFLAWRAHHRKGDKRFDNVKNHPPLFLVYWMVQACWVYLISIPMLVIQSHPRAVSSTAVSTKQLLSNVEILLLIGFGLAIFMEITSDVQKTVWIQQGRRGDFCTVGWWKYSRHPNYAGEILQWWFAAALAIVGWSSSSTMDIDTSTSPVSWLLPWISLVSPLFTMHILLNLSGTGVWNAEGKNLKCYFDNDKIRQRYIQYRAKTPPLFPVPFYERLPLPIKRVLCFEWKRYEYKER